MTDRACGRVAWGMVILTINCASVMWAYSLGLEKMTHATNNALGSAQYATVLLKRCSMVNERTLQAVWEVDYRLADSIIHLPEITLSDVAK